jgi:hypothetical protein
MAGMATPEAASGKKKADEMAERLREQLERLREASAITIPGYTVTSHAPLVGPLLAWLRRALTSHLREPYIDPILARQEAFNRELVQTVEAIAARLERGASEREALEQARQTLDECAQQLTRWLEGSASALHSALPPLSGGPSPEEITALRSRLEGVRDKLAHSDAE